MQVLACHLCYASVDACVRRVAQYIGPFTAAVERDPEQIVFLDLTPVEGRPDLIQPQWAALLEDIVCIPRTFGPVKQWSIFEETYFGPLPAARIYLLENHVDGRIAACVSDLQCRCTVFFLFGNRAALNDARREWKRIFQRATADLFLLQESQLKHLLQNERYAEAVIAFLGHLRPGTSAILSFLTHGR